MPLSRERRSRLSNQLAPPAPLVGCSGLLDGPSTPVLNSKARASNGETRQRINTEDSPAGDSRNAATSHESQGSRGKSEADKNEDGGREKPAAALLSCRE